MNPTLVSNTFAATAASGSSSVKTSKSKSELDTQDFLKLLSVQLANQNPLEPMKDSEYYAQIAQLGTTQGIDKLNKQADVAQAQTLMGKTVTAVRPGAATDFSLQPTVSGTVTKMTSKDGVYKIGIQEASGNVVEVELNAIQSIQPTANLSDYANLVGKNVTGMDDAGGAIAGNVTGLTKNSGNIMLQVKKADGTTVSISPSSLTKVG